MVAANSIQRSIVIALLVVAGCRAAPEPPRGLANIQVPAGFSFHTSESVGITLMASAARLPASGLSAIQIARPDGGVLFEGPLRAGESQSLRLKVPTRCDHLVALFEGNDGKTLRVELPIQDGKARLAM